MSPNLGPGNPGDCVYFSGLKVEQCLGGLTSNGTNYVTTRLTPQMAGKWHTEIGHAGTNCDQGSLVANSNEYSLNPGDSLYFSIVKNYTWRWSSTAWYNSLGTYVRAGSVCDPF